MNAVAISNNDMVYLYWHFEDKIPECLGFNVVRHDVKTGNHQPLPAMVGFPGDKAATNRFKDTSEWPVQKFAWKDLFAPRGGSYWYEIIPMIGKHGNLKPDLSQVRRTNTVVLDSQQGDCSVYFNRGIISTQAVAKSLPKGKTGAPSTAVLKKKIQNPKDKLRERLEGDLNKGVLSLLERAQREGGQCYCALYELADKELVDNLRSLGKKAHIVLSNAGEDTNKGSGDGDKTNQNARQELHKNKIDVTDRMLKKGHIGHNKFVVYVKGKNPLAVLTGSTNWTPTGLCAQSNNAIVIESPTLAGEYLKYWKKLKEDTEKAGSHRTTLQAKAFRDSNKPKRADYNLKDASRPADHTWGAAGR